MGSSLILYNFMTKYILVGGYVHKAKDGGKAFCEELVKDFSNKKPVRILDCMFARSREDWQAGIEKDNELFSRYINNFELELADPDKFAEQVENSDIVYLRGGYTTTLIELLSKDLSWTHKLEGKVLAGSSAGGDAIAKYYCVLRTQRVGNGFGLLPIKFVPHWKSDYSDEETSDIDWDKGLKNLKEYKEDLPIYTLAEGEFKVISV